MKTAHMRVNIIPPLVYIQIQQESNITENPLKVEQEEKQSRLINDNKRQQKAEKAVLINKLLTCTN